MRTKRTTIKATPNFSKRTFTLREYLDGELAAKYRTFPMSLEEFDTETYNTEGDWMQFLKTDGYFIVK